MNKYLELIDKPRANSVNVGLSSPKLSTLISLLENREIITQVIASLLLAPLKIELLRSQ